MNEPQLTPQSKLGLAGQMAKTFITSPLSLLLLLSFFAVGILGLMVTPRQEDPQISVPMVDVFVQYPGASSKQVEDLVSRPLESILSEMTGVDHVYSVSMRGQSMVTVQFEVGQDLESSLVKLYDKISSNRDRMPFGARDPLVKPKGVDDVPVVTITLWSNEVDDAHLRLIGMDVLQKLREVRNTSQSFIVSGRSEQVQVEILPERLSTFGVTLDQVAHTIQTANSERHVGRVEPNQNTFEVYSGAFLDSAEEVKRLMVAVVDGSPVYIRDIAEVSQGPSESNSLVGYYTGAGTDTKAGDTIADNAAAVTLAIAKKYGTNGVDVSKAVLERLESLKGKVIPDNVHVEITRDYGETAQKKVNDLITKLFIATGIVTILVCLALGVRAGIVVLLVIPSVITTTVFAAWMLGMTIDRVSLFALIFSIGILVDDAIVVVENIYRRWLIAGNQDLDVAVDSVREVGNPTILATATVIAALLPMGFVSGMMGPYMAPIPILGSIAMVISLFAAFAFTPWLTNSLRPSLSKLNADAEKEHKQAQWMERQFRRLIIPLVESKTKGYTVLLSIIVAFFVLVTLLYPFKQVAVKMLPLDNKPEFNIVINMPEGTALPVTANLVNEMAQKLKQVPEVTALQAYVGTASPFNFNGLVRHYYLRNRSWQADIQVQLLDKDARARSSHDIAVEARDMLTAMVKEAGGDIEVVEMPPGPPVLQTVVAEIYGPDDDTRRQVATDLSKMFTEAENLSDVRNLMEADHKVYRFKVDEDKVQRNGISVEDINRALEMAMGGFVVGDIKFQRSTVEPMLIVIQVPLEARSQAMRLAQLPVRNSQGTLVPLFELGEFIEELQDKPIFHKDLRPVEFVTAEGVGRLAAPVYGQFQVQDAAANYVVKDDGTKLADAFYWFKQPNNVDSKTAIVWGGEWTVTFETFRDMGIAFMGALILIYMLIVAQFGNFILPAIIMAPIPLTLIGIVPGHWILGAEFTATSMIGFIALAGIIVRNSILLVDFARESVRAGASVVDAVIHSCEARTRPILITALALIGGSSVIITDPIFQGMAVSLIFGGAVSTLLTLIVIPLGCISAGKALAGDMPDPDDNTPASAPADGTGSANTSTESGTAQNDNDTQKGISAKRVLKQAGMIIEMLALYLLALSLSIKDGLIETFQVIMKLRKKRRGVEIPKHKPVVKQTGSTEKTLNTNKTVYTPQTNEKNVPENDEAHTVSTVKEAQANATIEAIEKAEITPEIEVTATQNQVNEVVQPSRETSAKQKPKPGKRRGIKLKKDI